MECRVGIHQSFTLVVWQTSNLNLLMPTSLRGAAVGPTALRSSDSTKSKGPGIVMTDDFLDKIHIDIHD
jgi:hypothetical protein